MRVAHAADGDHALFKILAALPDLVVMDLAMPVLDGWETTRSIKLHPRTRHTPIIVLTGQVSRDSLHRARDVGADTILTKPCLPEALLSAAEKLLDR
jgi:CheY-like chemotaxis protein